MTRSSLLRGAAIGALCAVIAFFVFDRLDQAEWWLFDHYSRLLARSRPPDPRIVLVTVSESTTRVLAEFGRPQAYPREVYARALDELRRAGAAAVLFDIGFFEANENDPAGDRMLAEQLRGAPAILAANTDTTGARTLPNTGGAEWTPKLWNVRGAPASAPFVLVPPHPTFRTVAGIGTVRLAARGSASVHHYSLVDRVAHGYVPSLALEAVRLLNSAPREARIQNGLFSFSNQRIPVDRELQLLIRWNGAKREAEDLSYPNVDLDKLLLASFGREDGSQSAENLAKFGEQFRGKVVVIGFTAAGLLDLRPNPLSPKAAGLEIHANALDNLLNNDFSRTANRWAMFPLILLVGASFGAAVNATRSQVASGLVAIATLALILGAGYLALVAGFKVPAFSAGAAVALAYVVITVVKFIAEQQQTALLKMTFGRYVSPQILDHILAHPEKVRLGGERRDLTILFSDIRGFTSISEASEPEEVVEMLNEYLTRMVDILLAHGGTLDKFIGDAVMGFWNAPAPDPEHAKHAVACAIEMVQETARLRERWEAEGKPALRIGIGVNTGEAVVGNIGSERVFGYTVIGDAVNLASRLEGKNKDYVTEIIVSEFTLARIGAAFETVYLDDVKVKGKDKAVKIYQVVVA